MPIVQMASILLYHINVVAVYVFFRKPKKKEEP